MRLHSAGARNFQPVFRVSHGLNHRRCGTPAASAPLQKPVNSGTGKMMKGRMMEEIILPAIILPSGCVCFERLAVPKSAALSSDAPQLSRVWEIETHRHPRIAEAQLSQGC